MKHTTNYEMKLPEDTDELDVDVLDENFESIDGMIYENGLSITTLQNLISSLSTKVDKLAAGLVDSTYFTLWANAGDYETCDDIADYDYTYSDYQEYGDYDSAIMIVGNSAELAVSSSATIFFISWMAKSGDESEIYNVQGMLYPNGTVYTRIRYILFLTSGTVSNP